MEGKDPDKEKKNLEKDASGQPQKDNGKKKLIEGSDGKPQTENAQKNFGEEKYYKCFVCGLMCFSWRVYLLHAETEHKDHAFCHHSMGKFNCYYCYGEWDGGKTFTADTMEKFLIHVISYHQDWSYEAKHPAPYYLRKNPGVLVTERGGGIRALIGEDDEASQSSQGVADELPSDIHESKSDDNSGLLSDNQECKSDDHSGLPFDNQGHMSDQGSS